MYRRFFLVVMVGLLSCARVLPPPGGDPDKEPPRIVQTDPEQNATATDLAGTNRPVVIVFDETLSERSPREMIMVSPETGEISVDRDKNELRVTMGGGWKRDRVYRVTVLPGLVDRHGNARSTAYELVFSTGASIPDNAIGGLVTDRITGRPAVNARVEAISMADSTVYTTVTDSSGFYSLRALPVGEYQTRVYLDQNRNRTLDDREARALQEVRVATETDTLAFELALLAPDTTPARLLRAEIRDSLQVRLFFDDYLDPAGGLPPMRITAWQLPDSLAIVGGTIVTPRQFTARAQAARDTTAAAANPMRPQPADTARVLPINELVWIPPLPLRPSTRYRLALTGYRNLANIPDGGGSTVATSPAPPRAPPTQPTPRDTTRI